MGLDCSRQGASVWWKDKNDARKRFKSIVGENG
jgi:hypothetical protein